MSNNKVMLHRNSFIIHLVAFIVVMLGLVVVNYRFTPQTVWFVYPLIGWGIGVIMHFLVSVAWLRGSSEQTKEEWKKNVFVRAFQIHLIVYLLVNALLLFVNLTYTPEFLWVLFPFFGWGLGVVLHLILGLLWKKNKAA